MLADINHSESETTSEPLVMLAQPNHLPGAKRLSDQFKRELGFVNRAILEKAINAAELLVIPDPAAASDAPDPALVGFAHFYVRRDQIVTLYSIVVAPAYQGTGLGRRLFEGLVNCARERHKSEIWLKCPTELNANLFYEHLGLEIVRVEAGKLRPLNIWAYHIPSND